MDGWIQVLRYVIDRDYGIYITDGCLVSIVSVNEGDAASDKRNLPGAPRKQEQAWAGGGNPGRLPRMHCVADGWVVICLSHSPFRNIETTKKNESKIETLFLALFGNYSQ